MYLNPRRSTCNTDNLWIMYKLIVLDIILQKRNVRQTYTAQLLITTVRHVETLVITNTVYSCSMKWF